MLEYTQDKEIGTLTINRQDALNALNSSLLEEMAAFLEHHAKERTLRVLILTGAGDKAFIAGADIKEMAEMDHQQMLHFCKLGQHVSNLLETAPFATIAAVNGYALGGGLEMALACDFIYASTNAILGLPEVSLGIIPAFGGTQRLSRAVGTRMAKEMIMTGKKITAEMGKQIGLVNETFEQKALLEACQSTAQQIAKHAPLAVQQAKNAVNQGYSLGMTEALEMERNMCAVCFATEERGEAMQRFIEKRAPC